MEIGPPVRLCLIYRFIEVLCQGQEDPRKVPNKARQRIHLPGPWIRGRGVVRWIVAAPEGGKNMSSLGRSQARLSCLKLLGVEIL